MRTVKKIWNLSLSDQGHDVTPRTPTSHTNNNNQKACHSDVSCHSNPPHYSSSNFYKILPLAESPQERIIVYQQNKLQNSPNL